MQTDLWGINFFPEYEGEDFIEYDALINIRSYQGNPSRDDTLGADAEYRQ